MMKSDLQASECPSERENHQFKSEFRDHDTIFIKDPHQVSSKSIQKTQRNISLKSVVIWDSTKIHTGFHKNPRKICTQNYQNVKICK